MDGSQKWDQSTSSNSRHIMWKLGDEEKVGTFDSAATHGLFPVRSEHVSLSRATENWQLLLHKLGEMKDSPPKKEPRSQTANGKMVLENQSPSDTALPQLRNSGAKERAATHWRQFCSKIQKQQHGVKGREANAEEEEPSLPVPCEPSNLQVKDLASDLKLESFTLPPQQSCVVRGEPPKFAQGLLKDWSCFGKLEIPKTSRKPDQVSNPLQAQSGLICDQSTSSSSAEANRRNTSQIKSRPATRKLSTGTDQVTATTAKGKKCPSISSRSSGPNFPNFRQRQQELNRYRALIEQRRLDLLELRIAREREEANQYMILFQKKMQIKERNIPSHYYDCSNI